MLASLLLTGIGTCSLMFKQMWKVLWESWKRMKVEEGDGVLNLCTSYLTPPPPPQTHTHTPLPRGWEGEGGGQRISKWLNTDDIQRYTNCRTFRRRNGRCKHSYWLDITVWCMPLFPTLTNKPRIMSLNWVSSRSLSNFKSFFPSMFSSASFDVTILTLIFPMRKKKDVTIAFLTRVIRSD